MPTFKELTKQIDAISTTRPFGKVTGISGLVVEVKGLEKISMGSRCKMEDAFGNTIDAEIVGFKNSTSLLMPFGALDGIGPGCRVFPCNHQPSLRINNAFVGRVVNALGEPIDGKGPIALGGQEMFLKAPPPNAGLRKAVGGKLDVGVRALNTFVPLCKGQRMGIFAGSGVGKSVLMSMMSRYTTADVNVIGLIGERGREVREFIDQQLGEDGLAKSVVVVATSDEPPLMRRQAAYMSMTFAEYFRDCGFDVMLVMDSVTRFALAQREIGLSAGEPPTTRGFTPSVFSELPRLLERAGPGVDKGTISAIFTVLVEGGDLDEPVADAVRGILDGHIVLTRELAERGHFPAIDILKSVSRMLPHCHSSEENQYMNQARRLISTYNDMEELIRLGAYQSGTDERVDEAIRYHEHMNDFCRQAPSDKTTIKEGFTTLQKILDS